MSDEIGGTNYDGRKVWGSTQVRTSVEVLSDRRGRFGVQDP